MDEHLEEPQGWVERPWAARAVGLVAYLVPFVVSIAAAFALSSVLPQATVLGWRIARWVGIAIASTVVLRIVERQTRRLLPLRTLLGLTLAFPDRAPSRFKIAIRTGTTNQLRNRLDAAHAGKLGDTPSEAAERLLELVGMLSQHDRLTRGHSERVRAYTHLIGEEMGMTGVELDRLRWAGLLHDVGKLEIPTEILNKPDRLTDEEYDIVKNHPIEGRRLVAPLADWLGDSARAVWEHHERIDGRGYPYGLAGEQISLAARVVSVADVYDVMTSVRSYKDASSPAAARAELTRCAGTQFDQAVVKAFLNVSVTRVRSAMGPLSWIAQLSLFPQAVAAQAGPAIATTAAITAGAAAGTVGIAMGPVGPVAADSSPESTWVAHALDELVALGPPGDMVVSVDVAPVPEEPVAEPGVPVDSAPPVSVDDSEQDVASTEPPGELVVESTTTQPELNQLIDSTTSTSIDPAPETTAVPTTTGTAPPPTTMTTTIPTTTTVPTTTSPPTTTTTTTSTTTTTTTTTTTVPTTTTTIPPVPFGNFLYLGVAAAGNTASSASLPLVANAPTEPTLYNYDTDRDGAEGLLIKKDPAGADGTDPTKIQVFNYTFSTPTRLTGDFLIRMHVAAKDFSDVDIDVEGKISRCTAANTCTTIAYGDGDISNARRFKQMIVDFGAVDITFSPGERLEVRIAALDTSGDDMWLAYGTSAYNGRILIDD